MTDSNESYVPRIHRGRPASIVNHDGSVITLSGAVESERVELMQIQAMLKCLYEVLLYADDDDSTMHADVANVCARLLSDSIGRLDAVRLRCMRLEDGPDSPSVPPSSTHQVRDTPRPYLC